jgi:hypothetical protein
MTAVLKSLAAVGMYDTTMDGDVRVPYFMRTLAETAFPPGRDVIDPLMGGPNDPNRQQRLGIGQDAGAVEATLKAMLMTFARGAGVKLNTPADVRGVAATSDAQLDALIESLRLEGELPAAEGEATGGKAKQFVYGG